MPVCGSRGQRAWFFGIIYMWIRDVCRKSIYVKLFVHAMGLTSMILGLYFLVEYFLAPFSIIGISMILFGLVMFFTPFNLEIK
jgi:hypothetical protein